MIVLIGVTIASTCCIFNISAKVERHAERKYNSTNQTIIHICNGDTTTIEKINNCE